MQKSFGWFGTYQTIAELGVFNLPDKTPLKSAFYANLHDAYTYLAKMAADNEYQSNLNEYYNNQAKMKRKR